MESEGMLLIQVHSVDTNQPIHFHNLEFTDSNTSFTKKSPFKNQISTSKFSDRRGVIHLFRSVAPLSPPNLSSRSTTALVIAVPSSFSYEDFVRFCGTRIDHIVELVFIRNDAMEDRYSVMVSLTNQMTADGFYCCFNGKRFSANEAEVCHVMFLMSADFTGSAVIAGTPPDGFIELPTCHICLERLDPDTSGILTAVCDHSFQCPCTSKWTYVSCQVCRYCQQQDDIPTCSLCGTSENLWVCMICAFIGCGRYKEGHAIRHWKETQHSYSLDLTTQQIWDYVGDSYVHRLNQSKGNDKYGEMNSHCLSFGDCGSCTCNEDAGIGGALYNSKVDAIVDEYNDLLSSQLETQRQFYESLLTDAKSKVEDAVAEAVEKALTSKMHNKQIELDICLDHRNVVSEVNRKLIKDQEILRKNFKEVEERETEALKLKDEKILDLEEQIRDLSVFIEAQKTLDGLMDSDGIKGGTVLPVPSKEPSPPNTKKQMKSRLRRK